MPPFGPQPKQISNKEEFPGIIPIGGCIPWDPPTAGAPQPDLPTGWEYADGGTVTTVGSPKFGQTKPALMRTVENPGVTPRFIRGADTTSVYGGATAFATGGTATHTHSTSSAGSHNHGGTGSAGSHTHGSNTGSTSPGTSIESSNFGPAGFAAGAQTVALSHTHTVNSHNHTISSDGSHSHSIGSDGSHTHTALSTNNEPPYVDMAWIMRVL